MTTETERHPLLINAGIGDTDPDDFLLGLDFEDHARVVVPHLTFQYNPLGEVDTSFGFQYVPLCEESPELLRVATIARLQATGRDGAACWERLKSLVAAILADLPDNPSVLQDAWLVGLVPEMPARFRAELDHWLALIAEHKTEQDKQSGIADRAKATGERQIAREWVTDRCHNGNGNECSFDAATEYVLPDGSRQVSFRCRH